MKKLLLLTVFLFSIIISAQEADTDTDKDQKFSFGVKAGANFATITNLDEVLEGDVSGRTSFHAGGLGEYSLNENLSLKLEVLYSELGAKLEYSFDNYEYDFNTNEFPSRIGGGSYFGVNEYELAYLSIPLLVQYYIIQYLSFVAGPQISFLLAANEKWKQTEVIGDETFTNSGEVDIKDQMKSVDVGLAIGANYQFAMGLFFTIRYVLGMTDIFDYVNAPSSKNNVFQASAGFKFN